MSERCGRGATIILPFENRGEEIGVTLRRPQGQLYALPFVPIQLRRAAEAQVDGPVIARGLRDAMRHILTIQAALLMFCQRRQRSGFVRFPCK